VSRGNQWRQLQAVRKRIRTQLKARAGDCRTRRAWSIKEDRGAGGPLWISIRTPHVLVNKMAVQVEATVRDRPTIVGNVLRFEVVKHLICCDTARVNVPPPHCNALHLPLDEQSSSYRFR